MVDVWYWLFAAFNVLGWIHAGYVLNTVNAQRQGAALWLVMFKMNVTDARRAMAWGVLIMNALTVAFIYWMWGPNTLLLVMHVVGQVLAWLLRRKMIPILEQLATMEQQLEDNNDQSSCS